MAFNYNDRVILKVDIKTDNLRVGDIGTIVHSYLGSIFYSVYDVEFPCRRIAGNYIIARHLPEIVLDLYIPNPDIPKPDPKIVEALEDMIVKSWLGRQEEN